MRAVSECHQNRVLQSVAVHEDLIRLEVGSSQGKGASHSCAARQQHRHCNPTWSSTGQSSVGG